MTLVDPATGEIVASPEKARELTDQIRSAVEWTWELVAEAYSTQAWQSLGYGSWDDYCSAEFDGARIKLPIEERIKQVAALRQTGMSGRATAAALGIDRKTVMNDLKVVQNGPPEGASNDAPDEVSTCGNSEPGHPDRPREESPHLDTPPIKGTDGKTYKPPTRLEPTILTDAEQRVIDLAESNDRDSKRLAHIVAWWDLLVNFRDHSRRADIVALMHPEDRLALIEIEESIHA